MTKFVVISDTHQRHSQIEVPDGDVLIHCGDWTNKGSLSAIKDFLDWFILQPHEHLVLIAGNHELSLDASYDNEAKKLLQSYIKPTFHYLQNSSVQINGFNIYGSPVTPRFGDRAWNRNRGKDIAIEWAKIPDVTNILVTHGPAYGMLDLVEDNEYNKGRDLHQGCQDLAARIQTLKQLKLHASGHLHSGYGQCFENGIHYVNAAICNEDYEPVNKPIVIEL